ncbi:MAG: hypothetical protein U0T72_03865 [Chitinophagales bacterium]
MKHVLIFTYYWVPAGGVAVQRWLKLSKYLPQNGWQPIIVTVKDGSYPYTDSSLQQEVHPSIEVFKTDTFEPFELYNLLRGKKGKQLPTAMLDNTTKKSLFQKTAEYIRANFFIPDARKGWVKYAVSEGARLIKSKKIDAIITTGPPHSTHLIGMMLQSQFKVKWIADFRDPWTNIFTNHYLPRANWAKKQDERLESEVLKRANAVTVIGPSMKEEFKNRTQKIEVVWNGFDDADISFSQSATPTNHTFTIRYVGNIFASQAAPAFWQAVAQMVHQEKANLKIEFTGRVDESVQQLIAAHQLQHIVFYQDFVSHTEAVALMCHADALLFVVPNVPNDERIITGKIFEYLAAQKPILSFGNTNGDAAKLLQECGREPMCAFKDNTTALLQLQTAYNAFTQKNTTAYNQSFRNFSRSNQAKKVAEILNLL